MSPSFLRPRQGQAVESEVDACRRPDLVIALTGLLGRSVLVFSFPTEFFGQCLQTAHQPVITPIEAVHHGHLDYLLLLEPKLVAGPIQFETQHTLATFKDPQARSD